MQTIALAGASQRGAIGGAQQCKSQGQFPFPVPPSRSYLGPCCGYDDAIIVHLKGDPKLVGKTLPLLPTVTEGGIKWSCTATGYDTIEAKYRPTSCRR